MGLAVVAIGAVCLIVFLLDRVVRQRKAAVRLPPGPKGLPLVGNVLDVPPEYQWKTFAKWGEIYGDMVHVNVLGQPIVILNSAKAATDLLEKRSAIYSDRPPLWVAGELMGWKNLPGLAPYGQRWRDYRRMYTQFMGTREAIARFFPLLEGEVSRTLVAMVDQAAAVDPQHYARKLAVTVSLEMTHGHRVTDSMDPLPKLVERVMGEFAIVTAPGAFVADIIPILRHVPEWLPGAEWKRKANRWAKNLQDMSNIPVEMVKKQLAAGTARPSFTLSQLQLATDVDSECDSLIKGAAAGIFAGAADTMVSAVGTFFLAMCLHPEIVKTAQKEIDTVIGHDRLPTMADRERLPYVKALFWEVMRWHPVAPLGVPHRSTEDDVYEGYYIPAGSIMMANIWHHVHNPEVYADPFAFNPERFLGTAGRKPEPDPTHLVFGFGRRICPGIQLAESVTFLSCAMALSTLNITKADNFREMDPRAAHDCYTGSMVSHPPQFHCHLTPRSPAAEALIRAAAVYN